MKIPAHKAESHERRAFSRHFKLDQHNTVYFFEPLSAS